MTSAEEVLLAETIGEHGVEAYTSAEISKEEATKAETDGIQEAIVKINGEKHAQVKKFERDTDEIIKQEATDVKVKEEESTAHQENGIKAAKGDEEEEKGVVTTNVKETERKRSEEDAVIKANEDNKAAQTNRCKGKYDLGSSITSATNVGIIIKE